MKTTVEKIDTKLTAASGNAKGKEGVELREAKKQLKRLQRKKSTILTAKKKMEEKTKGKKVAPEAKAEPKAEAAEAKTEEKAEAAEKKEE